MFRIIRRVAARIGGRSGARRCVAIAVLMFASAAPSLAAGVRETEPAVAVSEDRGFYTVAATFTVTQASSFAMAALTDYDGIPRFMPEVRTSNVLERGDQLTVVEQEATARFMMFSKRVHLVLEVQQESGTIRFRDRCGKSFERYEGVWTITERDGGTHITYWLSAKPAFEVPEFLLKRLLRRDAGQMIERLKAEISNRAARHVN